MGGMSGSSLPPSPWAELSERISELSEHVTDSNTQLREDFKKELSQQLSGVSSDLTKILDEFPRLRYVAYGALVISLATAALTGWTLSKIVTVRVDGRPVNSAPVVP